MRRFVDSCAFVSLLMSACSAAAKPPAAPAILPLKSLRLYETGVGYFERSGTITAHSSVTLPVPAGHLDDALKSLVVLSQDAMSRVQGLEFGSSASKGMARALAGLPLDASTPITYRDLLASLKGAQVAVRTKEQSVLGRLIDVLDAPDFKPNDKTNDKENDSKTDSKREYEPALTLLLLTRDSEIRRFRSSEVLAVRPTEPALAARLDAALDALSVRGAQASRSIRVLARSTAPVTLGYIAETPVWRTTYRLVFNDSGHGATLQGWALVHNDTDEDWHQVRVHLVNGRPDSFLYPLAAPRYLRRELVHPDEELSTVPQLLDTTVDAIWGDHVEVGEAYGAGGLGLVGHGSGSGGGAGYGAGMGRIGSVSNVSQSSLLSVGNLAQVAQAAGVESGALFTYALAEALELRAHGSALVPFLQQAVEVEPITIFHAAAEAGRSAARIVNSTRQTLPAGTIAFFEDGGFAGESGLDRLKPGERRFVEYGADLDVELDARTMQTSEEPKRLTFTNESLEEHFIKRTRLHYTIENRSGHARAAFVVLGVVQNAQVTGADALDFDTAQSRPLAIFKVAAREKLERDVTTDEGLSRRTALNALTAKQLGNFAASGNLPQPDRDAARDAAAAQQRLEDLAVESVKLAADVKQVERDLDRLREHLKALGGDQSGSGATKVFAQRILSSEDQLTALRHKQDTLSAATTTQRDAVRAALSKLKPTL